MTGHLSCIPYPDHLVNEAYLLLWAIEKPLRWPTVKWLLSDVFNLNDAQVVNLVDRLEAQWVLRVEKGWIYVREEGAVPTTPQPE